MAYLPPPPPRTAPARRAPRRTYSHDLEPLVVRYADHDRDAARQFRRMLAPPLAEVAAAALGRRQGRQSVAQTAVSRVLARYEAGELAPRGVPAAFHGVAEVLRATGHPLLPWIEGLEDWERALLVLLDVELVDPERTAKAFHVPVELLRHAREVTAEVVGLAPPRESNCPGWPEVRTALRAHDDGAQAHRASCGRCTLVAEQTIARRRRLWQTDAPFGQLGGVFDPRRR